MIASLIEAVTAAAVTAALRPNIAAAPRPNIALLFMDDHGWGDLGANTGTPALTPEMDKLAADGLRFTDFHVAFSVCTPSRGALLTGRYGARTGITSNFGPESMHGMATGELTIANVLSSVGYEAAMIGKWHLGHNEPHHPTYRGFSSFFGLPYSGDMGCLDDVPQGCRPEWDRSKGQPACPALCPDDGGSGGCGSRGGSAEGSCVAIPLYDTMGSDCAGRECSDSISQAPFHTHALNSAYARRARELISMHSNSSDASPLFLYLAFAHTHTPLAYEARWENATARGDHSAVFANTLAELDWAVGQVTQAADDSGASWLLWLAADNGPADLASVACDSVGRPGPFVGAWQRTGGGGGASCKGTTWEGGHRVASIAYWRGVISPGVVNGLVHTLDMLPTFAALAGASLEAYGRAFDGADLSALLTRGDESELHERIIFHQSDDGQLNAMRVGQYKLFWETAGARDGCRINATHSRWPGGGGKVAHDPPLVFDLHADPGESRPLTNLPVGLLQRAQEARAAKQLSISTTMRSSTDYSVGGRAYWPCANRSSACCRLHSSALASTSATTRHGKTPEVSSYV